MKLMKLTLIPALLLTLLSPSMLTAQEPEPPPPDPDNVMVFYTPHDFVRSMGLSPVGPERFVVCNIDDPGYVYAVVRWRTPHNQPREYVSFIPPGGRCTVRTFGPGETPTLDSEGKLLRLEWQRVALGDVIESSQ